MPPDSIPAGYHCIACGYDAGGLPGYVCPECAEPVTDEAVVAWEARTKWREQWGRLLGHVVTGALIVCIAYSIGVVTLMGSAEAGLGAMVAMGVGAGASIGAGLLCSLVAPAGSRKVAGAIWLKWVWILHLPWLVVGPGALLVIAVVGGAPALGLDPEAIVIGIGLLGFMFWTGLVFTAPILWIQWAREDMAQARLIGRAWGLMIVAAIGLVVMTALLGGAGGAIALAAPMNAW